MVKTQHNGKLLRQFSKCVLLERARRRADSRLPLHEPRLHRVPRPGIWKSQTHYLLDSVSGRCGSMWPTLRYPGSSSKKPRSEPRPISSLDSGTGDFVLPDDFLDSDEEPEHPVLARSIGQNMGTILSTPLPRVTAVVREFMRAHIADHQTAVPSVLQTA